MRRKSICLSLALLILILGSVATALYFLTQHEPAFYGRAAVSPSSERYDLSNQFQGRSFGLVTSIQNGGSPETGAWMARFSEAELNSYFEEHFLASGMAEKMLPEGVSEPRIAIEQDRVRLGFRYGTPPWSTVISVDFRVWLAKAEPNVVVVELQGLHAGALPIAAQSLLENISEALRQHNIQVSWYRHRGNPTAALKFQSDQPRPTAQLRQLEIRPGMLTVVGHSSDPLPVRSGSLSGGRPGN